MNLLTGDISNFGKFSRGTIKSKFTLLSASFTLICLNLSKIRTKPVVPLILKMEDLIKEIKDKKDVILDILKKGVVVKGEEMFVKAIKDAKY